MATPEGKVKAAIKKVIAEFGDSIDPFWPVPGGYGESHLDCILCAGAFFVSIEVKAPGKKPTPRQNYRIDMVKRAGGYALVIDGTENTTTCDQLRVILKECVTKTMLLKQTGHI